MERVIRVIEYRTHKTLGYTNTITRWLNENQEYLYHHGNACTVVVIHKDNDK